jgi:WD repeat-containing protein 61
MPNKILVTKVAEFTGHQHPIYSMIAAPQPGRFFSAGGDKTVVEWDITNPALGIPIAKFLFTIYSLCLVPENQTLIAGTSEGGIHVIDLITKKEIKYIQLPGEGVFNIQYSQIHGVLVATTAKGNLVFMNPENFNILATLSISTQKIRSLTFTPTLPHVYVACSDAHIYVIDLVQKKKIHQFQAHQWACNAVYYHPVNDWLISGSKDAHLRVWDVKNKFELIKNIPAHNYAIYQVLYCKELDIYATASRDKTIKLWDQDMNILMRINKEDFNGHTNSVNAICWLGKNYLLSGSDDRKIMLWEINYQIERI